MSSIKRKIIYEFAGLPLRVLADQRYSAAHYRLLGAIASYDQFGRNGRGCFAGRKQLAARAGINETYVSDLLGDLRRWGDIVSAPNPADRRHLVHHVVYDEAPNRSEISDMSRPNRSEVPADRSEIGGKYVGSQNAKLLNSQPDQPLNILEDNKEKIGRVLGEGLRRNCAEARHPRKAETINPAQAADYLAEVEKSIAGGDAVAALRAEQPMLRLIADNDDMPAELRDRAAKLRDMA